MFNNIEVENLNHVADSWPLASEEEGVHPSQKGAKAIKVTLLFWIGSGKEDGASPVRLASVKIPKGTPISKVRSFVQFIEEQLGQTYDFAKRANMLFVADEDSETWEHTCNLPLYGVMYV